MNEADGDKVAGAEAYQPRGIRVAIRTTPRVAYVAALAMWVVGIAFGIVGIIADFRRSWADYPFLTNMFSSVTGFLFAAPVVLLVYTWIEVYLTDQRMRLMRNEFSREERRRQAKAFRTERDFHPEVQRLRYQCVEIAYKLQGQEIDAEVLNEVRRLVEDWRTIGFRPGRVADWVQDLLTRYPPAEGRDVGDRLQRVQSYIENGDLGNWPSVATDLVAGAEELLKVINPGRTLGTGFDHIDRSYPATVLRSVLDDGERMVFDLLLLPQDIIEATDPWTLPAE